MLLSCILGRHIDSNDKGLRYHPDKECCKDTPRALTDRLRISSFPLEGVQTFGRALDGIDPSSTSGCAARVLPDD